MPRRPAARERNPGGRDAPKVWRSAAGEDFRCAARPERVAWSDDGRTLPPGFKAKTGAEGACCRPLAAVRHRRALRRPEAWCAWGRPLAAALVMCSRRGENAEAAGSHRTARLGCERGKASDPRCLMRIRGLSAWCLESGIVVHVAVLHDDIALPERPEVDAANADSCTLLVGTVFCQRLTPVSP